MKVTVRGKNIEITVALREYVEKRAVKLGRYFDCPFVVYAVLSSIKGENVNELTCFVEGVVLRGVEKNNDMYAAIDLVVDKIVRQIHKHKTRLARRFKKQKTFIAAASDASIEEDSLEIVKRKHFAVRPMDVEEAIMQMNLVGHNFFMFFNAETEIMNVVYRRNDGKYGLLEPEL